MKLLLLALMQLFLCTKAVKEEAWELEVTACTAGYDQKTIPGAVTFEECLSHCENETSFVCRIVEFYSFGSCTLGANTKVEVGGSWIQGCDKHALGQRMLQNVSKHWTAMVSGCISPADQTLTGIPTVDSCRSACENDAYCLSFTYVVTTYDCWLHHKDKSDPQVTFSQPCDHGGVMALYTEKDYCLFHSCIHGQCQNSPNGYTCACDWGYHGTHCETGPYMSMSNWIKGDRFKMIDGNGHLSVNGVTQVEKVGKRHGNVTTNAPSHCAIYCMGNQDCGGFAVPKVDGSCIFYSVVDMKRENVIVDSNYQLYFRMSVGK